MESYGRFAGVYDVFMDNVNYREWADYIIETLAQDGIRDGLVLELGCGTGTVTEMLADAGYDMIGIDNSEEMLAEAMEKRAESGHDILYLLQDMQDFELYGTVRAVISVCDSMNYLTDEEDLEYLFALVNNYLDPGGLSACDSTKACTSCVAMEKSVKVLASTLPSVSSTQNSVLEISFNPSRLF